jgi:hypothetical protein
MKIAAILHKVGRETPHQLLDALGESVSLADIILAPDYALDFSTERPNTSEQQQELYGEIKSISRGRKTLIIPGTISYPIGNEMVHVAPVFCEGNLTAEFLKERDNGESRLAEKAGLTFKRGNSKDNRISFGGREIAVEVCGDHGTQDARGCDIELIMAYDKHAGFYINAGNGGWARKAVVCDGYKPFASAFDYDPARSTKLDTISGETIKLNSGKIKFFEI